MLNLPGYQPPVAETRDRTGDLQIFSLTLSQLSYLDLLMIFQSQNSRTKIFKDAGNIDVYVAYIKMQETSMRREQLWKGGVGDAS